MFVIGIIITSVILLKILIKGLVVPPPDKPAILERATNIKMIKPPNISKTGFSKKTFSLTF